MPVSLTDEYTAQLYLVRRRTVGTDTWIISLGRDPFSMGSHLLGALLSVVATYVLVRRARRMGMRGVGATTYGLLMTLAFSASALFHYVDGSSPRYELYNKLDHVAIFLMIAGTGTAIYAALQSWWTTYLTGGLWGCALLGIMLKLTFWSMADWLTAGIYLTVGWLGSLGVLVIGRRTDKRSVRLFILGGLAFSLGAAVYAAEWPTLWTGIIGAHEVFHIFVLLGAALHYGFVYRHCTVPLGTPNRVPAPERCVERLDTLQARSVQQRNELPDAIGKQKIAPPS